MKNYFSGVEPSGEIAKRKFKKPRRPCCYCGKFQSQLIRHLRVKHSDQAGVKNALSKRIGKSRNHEFDLLRKRGIYQFNMSALKNGQPLITERRVLRPGKLKLCDRCHGFYSRPTFHKHAKSCKAKFDVGSLQGFDLEFFDGSCSLAFSDLLTRFIGDDVGKLCKTDRTLRVIGAALYEKRKRSQDKVSEIRKAVSSKMRTLGNLYQAFSPCVKNDVSVQDMFDRKYFAELEEAIHNVASHPGGAIKAGLKIAIGNLLKSGSKILKGSYLIAGDDEAASNIEKFLDVLHLRWTSLFGDAEYQIMQNRQMKLRRPASLPNEEDVARIRDYTVAKLETLLQGGYEIACAETFISVRDLVVSRLTLFNSRRGGEPSRLKRRDWQDAKQGKWIDTQRLRHTETDEEAILLQTFRIIYQGGKGKNRLVPVLVPPDCVQGLDYLDDSAIRKESGVHEDNHFLFPSTRSSLDHASGWHCVKNVAACAGVGSSVTATRMRHRASTIYASMDVPARQREAFFSHMGHSDSINRDVYQCPLAIQEVTQVGKYFASIDGMQLASSSNRTAPPGDTENSAAESMMTQQEEEVSQEAVTAQPVPSIVGLPERPSTKKVGPIGTAPGSTFLFLVQSCAKVEGNLPTTSN